MHNNFSNLQLNTTILPQSYPNPNLKTLVSFHPIPFNNKENISSNILFQTKTPFIVIKPTMKSLPQGNSEPNSSSSTQLSSLDNHWNMLYLYYSQNEALNYATDYLKEIYYNLLDEERENLINLKCNYDYMREQPEINIQMRSILVDWLIDIHQKFNMKTSTLFLSIQIIDDYLSIKPIQRVNFQLLGIAAMLIASKHEEIFIHSLNQFIYVTDNAYEKNDLILMENGVLNALKFDLLKPTPLQFYEVLTTMYSFNKQQFCLGQYFLEMTLMDLCLIKHKTSVISLAAVYLVMKFFNMIDYISCFEGYLLRNHKDNGRKIVHECARNILGAMTKFRKSELDALKRKFTLDKYEHVEILWMNNQSM